MEGWLGEDIGTKGWPSTCSMAKRAYRKINLDLAYRRRTRPETTRFSTLRQMSRRGFKRKAVPPRRKGTGLTCIKHSVPGMANGQVRTNATCEYKQHGRSERCSVESSPQGAVAQADRSPHQAMPGGTRHASSVPHYSVRV